MAFCGLFGSVILAGQELLADPTAWDNCPAGNASSVSNNPQLIGAPDIFIATTETPNYPDVSSTPKYWQWDYDMSDTDNGAVQGYKVEIWRNGAPGVGTQLTTSDGYYGWDGYYMNGNTVGSSGENMKFGIGRGPIHSQMVYCSISASDYSSWVSSASAVAPIYIYGFARYWISTTTNLTWEWERSVVTSSFGTSGCTFGLGSSFTSIDSQDGTTTTSDPIYGIGNADAFVIHHGGGRGSVITPSAGEYCEGKIRVKRTWTAPNPDQDVYSDWVHFRIDFT